MSSDRLLPVAALAAAAALALGGCAAERDADDLFGPSEAGTLVVDAVLVVDAPFPDVWLSETLDPRRFSSTPGVGVEGARVTVTGDGSVTYLPAAEPGRYSPASSLSTVRPGTRYFLSVQTADGRELSATTLTPPRFDVGEWVLLDDAGESVLRRLATYDEAGEGIFDLPQNRVTWSQGLLEARFERPDVPAFQVGVFSLETDSPFVIDPDFFDEEDFEELDRVGSSPALVAADGRLRLPWFAIYFEGRYQVKVHAIDANWHDLVRSSPDFGGGPGFGGTAGDAFDRPLFRVQGGIGLFGSGAVDSIGFVVDPPPGGGG